jgi:hypothetical protein
MYHMQQMTCEAAGLSCHALIDEDTQIPMDSFPRKGQANSSRPALLMVLRHMLTNNTQDELRPRTELARGQPLLK